MNMDKQEWEKEFEKKWFECNCNGGWDYGQCHFDEKTSRGQKGANKDIKAFISSLLSRELEAQRRAIREEIGRLKNEPKSIGHHDFYNVGSNEMAMKILGLPSLKD